MTRQKSHVVDERTRANSSFLIPNSSFLLRATALSVSAILGTVIAFIVISGVDALIKGRGLSLFGAVWNSNAGHFGILTMIQASILLAISSLCVGWCLSLGCCCVMNGLAPSFVANFLNLILTLMTAIPTVVYGFAAVFLLVPIVREALGGTGFCWLTASMILALQGVPTMTFIMDGAVRTITAETELTASALGMTRAQHLSRIVLPIARKSLISAAILGLGRAVGDALIPTMLAGNAIRFVKTPLDSMRTLTAHISLVLSSDIGGGEHLSLLLAGALLLTFCAVVSLISRRMMRRSN
ncbi:MAG: ABC transporter permease subunit [Synergistaceae bacterium]|nr:ABC transporter permease subunit [Synergistaceae bacterium]MBR0094183.1 ABC transporter permease subunit [Synergistaceae bacterium]